MLAPDLTIVGTTPAGGRWLEELGPAPSGLPAPTVVCAVAASLRAAEIPGGTGMPVPSARVRTRAGRWVVLHASWLSTGPAPAAAGSSSPPCSASTAGAGRRADRRRDGAGSRAQRPARAVASRARSARRSTTEAKRR